MKKIKKCKPFFLLLFLFFSASFLFPQKAMADSKTAEEYKRDYSVRIYNSDDGLDGTAANCVYADTNGFIWVGCYAGLYRYDGTEFEQFLINNVAMPVNTIVEDQEGGLWIGTNGDGLFCYDGENFTEFSSGTDRNGVETIEKLSLDTEGQLWVGTKAGLFSVDVTTKKVREYKGLEEKEIADIGQLSTGEELVIEKNGRLYLIADNMIKSIRLFGWDGKSVARCFAAGESGDFYIGTDGQEILKVNKDGKVEQSCSGDGLYSFNEIMAFQEGSYWVCTDTGIGLLQEGELSAVEQMTTDSIEGACVDYQGNYWFASSRMGLYQMKESNYEDLGSYWGRNEVINSIKEVGDLVYVGTDEGLYCYQGQQELENELTEECRKERIRQIFRDQEGNIWVASYQTGLFRMDTEGKVSRLNTENSGLTTNKIRCIEQREDGSFLFGTEEGPFVYEEGGEVQKLIEDDDLENKRILDLREGGDGKIYAATDGYGLYVLDTEGGLHCYTKKDGLFCGCILKVVPSKNLGGAWLVMGEGICYISDDGYIQKVTNLPTANCLDLMLTEDGGAIIIASNGIFILKEKGLLAGENISYTEINKEDGILIDFTANSRNDLEGEKLYLCGTAGAMGIDFSKEKEEIPIRVYLEGAEADGVELTAGKDGMTIPSDTHRLTLSVRPINYIHRNISVAYYLEGLEEEENISENPSAEVSYTELKGGDYTFHYRIIDEDSKETLAKIDLPLEKSYRFWEEPQTRYLLAFAGLMLILLLLLLLVYLIEQRMKQGYRRRLNKMRENELKKLAYRDLVTGAYSRNYYETLVEQTNPMEVYAAFSVSCNYYSFYKMNQGLLFAEDMLRELVQTLQTLAGEDTKIFRISENIFFFCLRTPVQLEAYIQELKGSFAEHSDEKTIYSLSIGSGYREKDETVRELLRRCERMRSLDEKLAEAKFIEGKINSFHIKENK